MKVRRCHNLVVDMMVKRLSFILFAAISSVAFSVTPGPGDLYATDAYPGFDDESKILPQEKKTPSVFWWLRPSCDTPEGQYELARKYLVEGAYSSAANAFDALVASWPMSDQAPKAQEELADLYLNKLNDAISAHEEYKYLVDFFPTRCNHSTAVAKMYESAIKMREDGKKIMFFRFANTVDVRRAFEAVVLRASGASFAVDALFSVAELRVEDEDYAEAISVYKTIRNRYSSSKRAGEALAAEAGLRMKLLRRHEYNYSRGKDTLEFRAMAASLATGQEDAARYGQCRLEASKLLESEAYRCAKFYDSRTRKRRAAVVAYENFLKEYPAGEYANIVRERLAQIKEGAK